MQLPFLPLMKTLLSLKLPLAYRLPEPGSTALGQDRPAGERSRIRLLWL
ncbi:hypothetical protein [Ruegeria arenilitoris]|nr:hypothetical protein [Ruegeria arenilitoris]